MNFDYDSVMFLALFTLGAAAVIGLVSLMRAKRAQDHHEDAAVAERQRHEDPGAPLEGTPGHIDPTMSDQPGHQVAPGETGREGTVTGPAGRTWSAERGANPPTPNPPRN